MAKNENFKNAWSKLIVKAWQDPSFKKKLVENPMACLKEEGIEIPSGFNFKVVENSEKTIYLTLPAKPEGHLSEKELQSIAGGIYGANPPWAEPLGLRTSSLA